MEEITREEINKNRIEEIERIRKLSKEEEPQENEEYREPLSIDQEQVFKILLSWGGGSDGFKLYFNKENYLLRGVYFMANWGVYEESELTEEEAEEVYNFYMYGDVKAYKN